MGGHGGDADGPLRVQGRLTEPGGLERWSPEVTLRCSGSGQVAFGGGGRTGDDRLLGWTAAELQAIPGRDLVHPDDRDLLEEPLLDESVATGRFVSAELRMLARDGGYWWTRWHRTCSSGTSAAWRGVEYLRPAGRGCPVGTWRWDVERDAVSWSPELLDMFGLVVGPPVSLAAYLGSVHEDDRDDIARRLRVAVVDGQPFHYTFRSPTADETVDAWFYAAGCCCHDGAGRRVVTGLVKYLNPPPSPPVAAIGWG